MYSILCQYTIWLSSLFLAFELCRFCVVIRFFHPRHNGQWPQTSKDFLSQMFFHYIYFPILILEKEPVFPYWMFSDKQGNYWYHFYNGPWLGIEPGTSLILTYNCHLHYRYVYMYLNTADKRLERSTNTKEMIVFFCNSIFVLSNFV